ncbi:hypothetical protein [Reinekea sp. G2M2-21]|uniref:hypothetical protein n=1 Tax=Reinekea sp. G2M2-21 TaxID=2788942 RepID=UPI0018AA1D0F|nr:hypothetical protein [Reinekea sp. G2M2-21]
MKVFTAETKKQQAQKLPAEENSVVSRHRLIEQEAYMLGQSRAEGVGDALDDWLLAEKRVDKRLA